MNVLAAVLVVGLGSVVLRLGPLLGAERLPERFTRASAWAGLSVLAALTVRAVTTHQDASLPQPLAPVAAAVAVGLGLVLAHRGRPVLVAVSAGAATYLLLGLLLTGAADAFSAIHALTT